MSNDMTAQLAEALRIIRVQYGDYKDGDGAAKLHACQIADEALAHYQSAPQDSPSVAMPASAEEASECERIIVLSDGETWEGFDPDRVRVMDITLDAHARLCEGAEPSDLSESDIIADRLVAELARERPSDLQHAIERDKPEGPRP